MAEDRIQPAVELRSQSGPLETDEWREAMRACRGMTLRQEIYELDVDALHARGEHRYVRLFSAAQHSCHIRRLQPRGPNRHAVFLVTESEAINYQYELALAGARAGFLASGYQRGTAVLGARGSGQWWMRSGVAGFAANADRRDPFAEDLHDDVCRRLGDQAIKEVDLRKAVGFGPDTEYSRSHLASVSRGTLTNLYRQRGHWRATMARPTAAFEKSADCSGAAVTVTVDEGAPYQWDRADWTGNAAFAAADLDKLMPMKSGDLANVTMVDDGIRRVQKAYGTRGYIMQQASYTPRLNDTTHRAVFEVRIVEGPQFRLGAVSFHGLDPKGVETLNNEWKLKPGDVFDASYPGTVFADVIRPRLRPSTTPPSTKLDVDEKNRIVNVGFVFGG